MTYPHHNAAAPPVPAPAPQRKFRPLAWVAFGVALAGCALIPIPILNNAGAILGVAGVVMSLISVWGTERWLSVAALTLSGLAVIGTVVVQQQLVDDLNDLTGKSAKPNNVARAAAPDTEEPEPPAESWPSASDLTVDLKVTEKQCFGSAGCSITVTPELNYNGYLDPDTFGQYTVTIAVAGDESGEVISTLEVSGSEYNAIPLFLSTKSGDVAVTGKIVSVN